MAYDVYPRHNLPSGSEDWGRAITDATRDNSYRVRNLGGELLSLNRSSAGQFGSFARSVREVETQSAQIVEVPDLTVTVTSASSGSPSYADKSITVQLPPPADGSFRPPLVQLFGQVYGSQNEFHYDWVFIGAFGLSSIGTSMSLGGGRPPSWNDDIILTRTLAPGTSSITFQLRGAVINPGTTSITETVGMVNTRLSVMYGGL